jgi:hypothetical protein
MLSGRTRRFLALLSLKAELSAVWQKLESAAEPSRFELCDA